MPKRAARRWREHDELKILLMSVAEDVADVPDDWWRSRACWGLEEAEMRCLLHVLDTLGVPAAAGEFVRSLRSQTETLEPMSAEEELLLCTPPE